MSDFGSRGFSEGLTSRSLVALDFVAKTAESGFDDIYATVKLQSRSGRWASFVSFVSQVGPSFIDQ